MTRFEVHQELAFIGVNSPEVHNLVDDLDLCVRVPPLGEKLLISKSSFPNFPDKHVYQPHTTCKEATGWLFEDNDSPLWKMFRVSSQSPKRICGLKLSRSKKRR